jgi:hypothetical protein
VTPSYFASIEGGNYKRWNHGPVSRTDLRTKRDKNAVYINGCLVHALIFGTDQNKPDMRWDCINGYTHEFGQPIVGTKSP